MIGFDLGGDVVVDGIVPIVTSPLVEPCGDLLTYCPQFAQWSRLLHSCSSRLDLSYFRLLDLPILRSVINDRTPHPLDFYRLKRSTSVADRRERTKTASLDLEQRRRLTGGALLAPTTGHFIHSISAALSVLQVAQTGTREQRQLLLIWSKDAA